MFRVFRFGRRILLLVSEVLMALSLVSLGYYFYRKEVTDDPIEGGLVYMPIVATLSFIASFDIGLGKVQSGP